MDTAYAKTADEVSALGVIAPAVSLLQVCAVRPQCLSARSSFAFQSDCRRCWPTMAPTPARACRRRRWPRPAAATDATSSRPSRVRACAPCAFAVRCAELGGENQGHAGAPRRSPPKADWLPARWPPRNRRPRCSAAGTPFWKLVLKQFDDLLVKVGGQSSSKQLRLCPAAANACRSSSYPAPPPALVCTDPAGGGAGGPRHRAGRRRERAGRLCGASGHSAHPGGQRCAAPRCCCCWRWCGDSNLMVVRCRVA